jgi:glycosyltransferase involved in cell wall biosynthesis
LGGAGILVDPVDTQGIMEAMRRLLLEPTERERLRNLGLERAKEFSWKKAAELTLEIFQRVAGQK